MTREEEALSRDTLLATCRESLRLLEIRLDLADIGDDEKRHLIVLRAAIRQAEGGA